MGLNRRQFVILGVVLVAGCNTEGGGGTIAPTVGERVIDAGPAASYSADGVYDGFREQGFFVIRSGEKLFALSAICTHRACKLNAASDHSFYCKCHGSTFDDGGKVTKGPARRDLPTLPVATTADGRLLVSVPAV